MTGSADLPFYNLPNVLNFIDDVEGAYNVRLSFWLKRSCPDGITNFISVVCAGSGEVFDLLSADEGSVEVWIEGDGRGAFSEALYFSVKRLERTLNHLREPVGPRPSL
jgi:hypothetical protein